MAVLLQARDAPRRSAHHHAPSRAARTVLPFVFVFVFFSQTVPQSGAAPRGPGLRVGPFGLALSESLLAAAARASGRAITDKEDAATQQHSPLRLLLTPGCPPAAHTHHHTHRRPPRRPAKLLGWSRVGVRAPSLLTASPLAVACLLGSPAAVADLLRLGPACGGGDDAHTAGSWLRGDPGARAGPAGLVLRASPLALASARALTNEPAADAALRVVAHLLAATPVVPIAFCAPPQPQTHPPQPLIARVFDAFRAPRCGGDAGDGDGGLSFGPAGVVLRIAPLGLALLRAPSRGADSLVAALLARPEASSCGVFPPLRQRRSASGDDGRRTAAAAAAAPPRASLCCVTALLGAVRMPCAWFARGGGAGEALLEAAEAAAAAARPGAARAAEREAAEELDRLEAWLVAQTRGGESDL